MLERIGHLLRMGNDRLTKAMVLRWYEGLKGRSKMICEEEEDCTILEETVAKG